MSIREIKREARQTLKGLKGKYLLFLVPIILSIFYSGIEVHQTYVTTQGIEVSVGASYFPLIVLIMLTVFTLSAAYTMLEVIRYYRREVSFSEATIAFSGNLFWQGSCFVDHQMAFICPMVFDLDCWLGYPND